MYRPLRKGKKKGCTGGAQPYESRRVDAPGGHCAGGLQIHEISFGLSNQTDSESLFKPLAANPALSSSASRLSISAIS